MNTSKLIVGLGNPGKEYERTRHNVGFLFIDYLLNRASSDFSSTPDRLSLGKKRSELWRVNSLGPRLAPFILLKPLTYMNNSGESVLEVCSFYNIEPENVVVVHDEMDIPAGSIRVKRGGGSAGHKGIKSIEQHLGTKEFYRIRLGIGKHPFADTVSFVLGRFNDVEEKLIAPTFPVALDGIITLQEQGLEQAMQLVNSYKPAK